MNSHDNFLKDTWREWVKQASQITEVVGELEKEIERMREKKLAENIIDHKDQMVERIINFYNTTEQLMIAYRVAITNKQAEVMIMGDCLEHALKTEWRDRILKRLSADVNEMKERKELKQNLIKAINGEAH